MVIMEAPASGYEFLLPGENGNGRATDPKATR